MPTTRASLAPSLMLGLGLLVAAPALAPGQASSRTATVPAPRPAAEVASTSRGGRPSPGGILPPASLRASVRVEGIPSPGLRVKLDGSGSSGSSLWYRWLQTEGPKVALEGPNGPEAEFTVPMEADKLAFVLVVGDATGVDVRSVTVDIDDPERESNSLALKADAGDDQAAKVGRRVVLNGVRSEPNGRIKFRWIQTAGPKVALKASDAVTCSFTPLVPGPYQFALVVASTGGMLSEADQVTINVTGSARSAGEPIDTTGMAIDELAKVSLATIDGGPRYSDELARAFDGVADRIGAYKSYSDAIAEMTRRLDAVVPRDKERRAVWVERLFTPIMAKIVVGMRLEGLDITQPEGQTKELSRSERAKLAEQFRYTAAGFRSSRVVR